MARGGLLGGFATAFAFAAWQPGGSRIGANLVYQYLISIMGVVSGLVFCGEVLGVEKIAGGAVPSWACTRPGDDEDRPAARTLPDPTKRATAPRPALPASTTASRLIRAR